MDKNIGGLKMINLRKISIFVFLLIPIFLFSHKTTVFLADFGNASLNETLSYNASKFITMLNLTYFENTYLSLSDVSITKSGIKTTKSLWSNNKFYCTETEIIQNIIKKTNGNYELRGIPIGIKKNPDSFIEKELVLEFTPTGMIDNIRIALEQKNYHNIIQNPKSINDYRRRQKILEFIEIYRTAYNLQDTTFIQKVFSDDALIIVGRVLKKAPINKDVFHSIEEEKVELIRYSKKEYIDHLKEIFSEKNYSLEVEFENIEIMQHPKHKEIYGITIFQKWNSSIYSDEGFLFLMIDFKDEQKPVIWVRAWQPQEFTKENDVIDLSDIQIIE